MGGGKQKKNKKHVPPPPPKDDLVALLRTTEREAIDELVFRRDELTRQLEAEVEAKVED